jgi:hypothetical protein
MKSIYVHLNPLQFSFSNEFNQSHFVFQKLPDYAYFSIKQTKYFLQEEPIVLENDTIDEFKQEIEQFFYVCKTGMPSFYSDPFWFLTLLRLYVVYLYKKKKNIKEFLHLEYDNLIYSDLNVLKNLTQSIYFTRVGPYQSSAGFVYCNSLNHFEKFIKKIIQLIEKGENFVQRFTQYNQLSEMIMIDLIHTHTKDTMDYLPILSRGIGNDNFNKLGVLFDGASYGQYLGGTNNGGKEGWYGLHHYIGQQLRSGSIKVFIDNKKPVVMFNNTIIPICNLHVHSKQLEKFIYP